MSGSSIVVGSCSLVPGTSLAAAVLFWKAVFMTSSRDTELQYKISDLVWSHG